MFYLVIKADLATTIVLYNRKFCALFQSKQLILEFYTFLSLFFIVQWLDSPDIIGVTILKKYWIRDKLHKWFMEKWLEGGKDVSCLPVRGRMMMLDIDLQFSLVSSICWGLESLLFFF